MKRMEKKIFLEDLPRWSKGGKAKEGTINWSASVGMKVKFQYDDICGEVEIVGYEDGYLYIKYEDKEILKIKIDHFKNCYLGKLLEKRTGEFKISIGDAFKDDKRDIIVIGMKREGKYKYYKYKCNKCGYKSGLILESALLKGGGCSCCAGVTIVQGINDIPTTAPWMVKYFKNPEDANKYTKNNSSKIQCVCPECGSIKNKEIAVYTLYRTRSIGCPKCSDGQFYPNKFMFDFLNQLNIDFQTEYSPEWISPKRYDFYFELNNKKYIIEMDGRWHKKDNNMNGQSAKKTKEIDDYKDLKANEHRIEVVRIDCKESELEWIRDKILSSKLNNLFNLSNIDWLRCE